MRKLSSFMTVSVDGYFTDAKNDMSWAHQGSDDTEFNEFVSGNAQSEDALVFGRITYEMMASFWPSPQAVQTMPVVAEHMNKAQKLVFSRTLKSASWQNTTVVNSGDLETEVGRLKSEPGSDMVILGSGSLVSQLSHLRLIDEYQIVVAPIVLGAGRSMFSGVADRFNLSLTRSRSFKNGKMVLYYSLNA